MKGRVDYIACKLLQGAESLHKFFEAILHAEYGHLRFGSDVFPLAYYSKESYGLTDNQNIVAKNIVTRTARARDIVAHLESGFDLDKGMCFKDPVGLYKAVFNPKDGKIPSGVKARSYNIAIGFTCPRMSKPIDTDRFLDFDGLSDFDEVSYMDDPEDKLFKDVLDYSSEYIISRLDEKKPSGCSDLAFKIKGTPNKSSRDLLSFTGISERLEHDDKVLTRRDAGFFGKMGLYFVLRNIMGGSYCPLENLSAAVYSVNPRDKTTMDIVIRNSILADYSEEKELLSARVARLSRLVKLNAPLPVIEQEKQNVEQSKRNVEIWKEIIPSAWAILKHVPLEELPLMSYIFASIKQRNGDAILHRLRMMERLPFTYDVAFEEFIER